MTRHDQLIDQVDDILRTGKDISDGRCFCASHFISPHGDRIAVDDWYASLAIKKLNCHLLPVHDVFRQDSNTVYSAKNGTLSGYTNKSRGIWLHPYAKHRLHAAIHELAHQALGHCETPNTTKAAYDAAEREAELTVILVFDALGLPDGLAAGVHYLREYGANHVPERHRHRAAQAADRIVAAGRCVSAGLGKAA